MKSHVQAAAAAIAIAHNSGRRVSGIIGPNGAVNVEVTVKGKRVEGYDYSNSCHVDGNLPDLYHYGQSAHLELTPKMAASMTGTTMARAVISKLRLVDAAPMSSSMAGAVGPRIRHRRGAAGCAADQARP